MLDRTFAVGMRDAFWRFFTRHLFFYVDILSKIDSVVNAQNENHFIKWLDMKIFYTMHNWNRFRRVIFLWILFKMSRPLAWIAGRKKREEVKK